MKASELKRTLTTCMSAKLPVLIKGAPGIGKSDIVAQAAEDAGFELIITHPVVEDPTDKKGLPGIVEGQAEFLPYGDLRKMMDADQPTVVFLDDLGQAPPAVQAANMQLLLAREVNGQRISEEVTFVAATNRKEDRAGVSGILEPVKSRFATIVELEVDIDDWCEWAFDHDILPEVVAFVRFRSDLVLNPQRPTGDIVNRPCPRTVAFASKLISLGLDSVEVLSGACGEGFAHELVAFLKVFKTMPNIDAILMNPDSAPVPEEMSSRYAVSMALVHKATEDNAGRIIQYAVRLPVEFTVLTIKSILKNVPEAANCSEFVQWAAKNQDILN